MFLVERSDGSRHAFEVACHAPDGPSAAEVLASLVHDARFDLAEIGNVVRFGVGYVAHLTTKIQPVDPPIPEATTRKRTVVMVEAHSADEHLRSVREIADARPLAMGDPLDTSDSIYAGLLTEVGPR